MATTFLPPPLQTSAGRDATSIAAPNLNDPARWAAKAAAYGAGWAAKVGGEPSLANLVLGLSVAEHETWCGDAWPGEHNWGACQKRVPNAAEKAVLAAAKLAASPSNVGRAVELLAAAAEAGKVQLDPQAALHADSSPGKGYYFVFFWAFQDDAAGAAFFVDVLAGKHASTRLVLTSAKAADAASAYALAASMYSAGYYEGFYVKAQKYPQKVGPDKTGAELNVEAYASAILKLVPTILAALSPAPAPSSTTDFDFGTVKGYQAALAYVAKRDGRVEEDPGGVDGVAGPKTRSAVEAFQRAHGLAPDGVAGPSTIAALQKAVAG